ncbi:MAG: SpoIID/LytB domain-containing protein, partial [Actinomycetota bacterium]|nr:SpoIID/LytB domain-containing protein [Actinomycetota bacterium]
MRRTALLILTGLLGAGLALLPAPATAEEVVERPADGVLVVEGHGWGHGRGMSQWGAQGAASLGRTADEITSAYYPGTARAVLPDSPVRVWLSGDEGRDTVVSAAAGLRATDAASGVHAVLPAGPSRWRVVPDATGLQLQSLTGGAWTPQALAGRVSLAGPVRFDGPVVTRVVFPGGASRDYRGSVSAVRRGTGLLTVVSLGLEDYLLGVVPREASSGWRPAALQAQAIAARSYSAYKRDRVRAGALYDICDSTACQVFGGTRLVSASGRVTELEPASTSEAVRATRGVVRTWQGRPVLAEFSSSNGGHSTAGHVPYLVARPDPWDGAVANPVHSWTARLPVTALERRFPALGALQRLRVTARDGGGAWGGRVRTVVLEGSRGSVTTTGAAVYAAAAWPGTGGGLRSSWWRVRPSVPPVPPVPVVPPVPAGAEAGVLEQSAAPALVRPPGTSRGEV